MLIFEIANMRQRQKPSGERLMPVAALPTFPGLRRNQPRRRGSVIVLAVVFLVIAFACLAFAVDVGYLCLARSQAQNGADASAMAAAWNLLDERRLQGDSTRGQLASEARDVAVDYSARNKVCGSSPQLDRNDGNNPNGDLVFGRLNSNGQMSTFGNLREHNAVLVRIRRTDNANGPVRLFFGRALGIDSADVGAEAVATFRDGISGFRPTEKTGNTTLIPFAVPIDTWRELMGGRAGADNWFVNPETNELTAGPDGILELEFYPDETGSSGNFGTLQIGDSNNGTGELNQQIIDGISEADLAFHGGAMETGPWPGDPGISGGIKHGLEKRLGDPCSIALYDSVSGSGNNSVFNVVGFAGVRVVDVWEDGNGNNATLHVVLQPAVVVDDSAVAGNGSGYSVYQPVILAR